MQKGFATLEIVLATMIIALLVSVTIPNAARVVDRVALDYETKKLYSDLRLVQQINRSATVDSKGLGRMLAPSNEKLSVQLLARGYRIMENTTPFSEIHYMRNIKTLETNLNIPDYKITFDTTGKTMNVFRSALSGNLTLTSQFGRESKIVFTSVGRFRGGRADE